MGLQYPATAKRWNPRRLAAVTIAARERTRAFRIDHRRTAAPTMRGMLAWSVGSQADVKATEGSERAAGGHSPTGPRLAALIMEEKGGKGNV
jgi:hypothetical protein